MGPIVGGVITETVGVKYLFIFLAGEFLFSWLFSKISEIDLKALKQIIPLFDSRLWTRVSYWDPIVKRDIWACFTVPQGPEDGRNGES